MHGGFNDASKALAIIVSLWVQVWTMFLLLYFWAIPYRRSFLQGRSQMHADNNDAPTSIILRTQVNGYNDVARHEGLHDCK